MNIAAAASRPDGPKGRASATSNCSTAIAEVWGTAVDRARAEIDAYCDLYALPIVTISESRHAEQLLGEQDAVQFILVAIVHDGAVFVDAARGRLTDPPRLPGRALRGRETHLEAAHALVKKSFPTATGIEAVPIAIVVNRFTDPSGLARTHMGVAMRMRIAGNTAPLAGSGYFATSPPDPMLLANLKIARLALSSPMAEISEREAATPSPSWLRQSLHDFVVRPLLYAFGSLLVRRATAAAFGRPRSLIDLAAGDDVLGVRFAARMGTPFVVFNDANYASTERVRSEVRRTGIRALITQHDISDLPFSAATRFDVALLKNVLHHLPNMDAAERLLRAIPKLCRRLVVVEPEDPRTTIRGRALNFYYERVLGDGDADHHHFLTLPQLANVMQSTFEPLGATVKVDRVETIKGRYLIAVVEFPS